MGIPNQFFILAYLIEIIKVATLPSMEDKVATYCGNVARQ